MVSTAPSGRSWLIRAQMIIVIPIVTTMPQAMDQNRLIPNWRKMVSTNRKTTVPTPHAT